MFFISICQDLFSFDEQAVCDTHFLLGCECHGDENPHSSQSVSSTAFSKPNVCGFTFFCFLLLIFQVFYNDVNCIMIFYIFVNIFVHKSELCLMD